MSEQQCVFGGENQVLDSIAQVIRSRKIIKLYEEMFSSDKVNQSPRKPWQVSQAMGWTVGVWFTVQRTGVFCSEERVCAFQRVRSSTVRRDIKRKWVQQQRSAASRIETLRRSASGMYSNAIERGWVYEIPTVWQSIFPSNKVQVCVANVL